MSVLSKFYHQITGRAEGPKKLVFLHGVMGFSANWRRIAKAFETDFQILVYDQRGHGRSHQPAIGYAPADYSADLHNIIDELGWETIHLVGHSMGGRAAYHFAAHNPDRVTRLVIEDIGPSMYQKGADFISRMLDSVPVPFENKRLARAWFDTEFPRIFANHPKKEQLAEYLYANIMENDKKEAVWRFFEPGIKESIAQGRAAERWEDIRALTMPTLVIRGERSTDLPREIYDRMLSENPRIKGVEIKDSGHWVHSDEPELFIHALKEFFNDQPLPNTLP